MRCMVTMKFSPVRIDEKPEMKMPMIVGMTLVRAELRAERRVEGPAGIDAAGEDGPQGDDGADREDVPAEQVELGKGEVAGADHQRQEEIAQHGRHHRHEEEEHHDDAVSGEQLVVGVGRHQFARRRHQVETDHRRGRPAEEEHERDREQVEDGDALVVVGQQPRLHAVGDVQIVDLGRARRTRLRLRDKTVVIALLMAGCSFLRGERLGRACGGLGLPPGGVSGRRAAAGSPPCARAFAPA